MIQNKYFVINYESNGNRELATQQLIVLLKSRIHNVKCKTQQWS